MRLLRWTLLLAVVPVAGCNDDAASVPSRCAEFIDLFQVPDAAGHNASVAPWPANTHGDERLEFWFRDYDPQTMNMVGFGPDESGGWSQQWEFSRSGDFERMARHSGDEYSDYLVRSGDDDEVLSYYPTMADGLPAEDALPITLLDGEVVYRWVDVDGDGIVDRMSRIDDDFWWVSGATGEAFAFGLELPEDAPVYALFGRPLVVGTVLDGVTRLGLLDEDGYDVIVDDAPHSFGRGSGVHEDHIDLFEWRSLGSEKKPFEVWLSSYSMDGEFLSEQLLAERATGGLSFDYDGDGHRDLFYDQGDDENWIRFGSAEHEFSEAQEMPSSIDWSDAGWLQSFDVDADGRVELLVSQDAGGGMRDWMALGFVLCGEE